MAVEATISEAKREANVAKATAEVAIEEERVEEMVAMATLVAREVESVAEAAAMAAEVEVYTVARKVVE